jgi:hypothetical protein
MTTLQQTIDTIDETYPVAGKDNDSAGFRNNFDTIKTALTVTNTTITTLQGKALLAANLTDNTPVQNDLNNASSINNGFYNNFWGTGYVAENDVSGSNDIDVTYGGVQQFMLSGNATFRFVNWPDGAASANYFASIRIHLLSDGTNEPTGYSAIFTSSDTFKIATDSNLVYDGSTNRPKVICRIPHTVLEAWTYDGGTTVYVRRLGSFA